MLQRQATCDSVSAKCDDVVVAEDSEAEDVEASWKALNDASVVADNELFFDYVNADADVVTTEEPTDDSIVADVAALAETSDDEGAMGADSRAFTVPTSS